MYIRDKEINCNGDISGEMRFQNRQLQTGSVDSVFYFFMKGEKKKQKNEVCSRTAI